MKLAFCLFNYFPFGGLEQNFLKISTECLGRGHNIDIYTMKWEGACPAGAKLINVSFRGKSNHDKIASFAGNLATILEQKQYNLIIGFNKIPGLDIYYAADVCYKARIKKQRLFLSRFTPRYRLFSAFEKAVFGKNLKTEIIIISEKEKINYQSEYDTEEKRLHIVPPGVDKDYIRSSLSLINRNNIRDKLGLGKNDIFLLMIGSHFHTKGVDRSINALACLPLAMQKSTYLFIIGKGKQKPYAGLAKKLGLQNNVRFLGSRSDIPLFLAGADFVLQPSRVENTGNVIVEALTAGVPVMATETCGYAVHIERAKAGMILPSSKFSQKTMNIMLKEMLLSEEKDNWKKNALSYSDSTDLYNRVMVVADLIEEIGAKKKTTAINT
ncbi:glycosyltransferase family 4 protein [Desulfobacterium sp. N47]|uniref:Lipopolysaccharide core biosynthesis protein rfaG n=1 Tax=uncultured Desulfobacterium sp. TaxID=201089 RepID=E1YD16_9BACT|nr:Lipopolysaccharide core biosynthesis protein rfaG [uncultured Desulfobacterium sp.]